VERSEEREEREEREKVALTSHSSSLFTPRKGPSTRTSPVGTPPVPACASLARHGAGYRHRSSCHGSPAIAKAVTAAPNPDKKPIGKTTTPAISIDLLPAAGVAMIAPTPFQAHEEADEADSQDATKAHTNAGETSYDHPAAASSSL